MKTPPSEIVSLADGLDEAPLKATSSAWRYLLFGLLLFVASSLGLVSLFGDNIRALFGASAGGLIGVEERVDYNLHGHAYREIPAGAWGGRDLTVEEVEWPPPTPPAIQTEKPWRCGTFAEPRPSPGRTPRGWDRSKQSVWRYEYPPGDIWKVRDR